MTERVLSRIELLTAAAVVAIIAVIAVPGLLRSRMSGNEAAAIGSLRAIVSAETAYASACGRNRYAPAFATLGLPAPGGGEPYLPPELAVAVPELNGYRFTLSAAAGAIAGPADCNGTPTTTGYYATAVPIRYLKSGGRSFAVDTAGTIWQNPSAAAPYEPFAAPSTPIQ
ncbi:MAG: hypothetical protein WD690_01180 [Vicinamibacterales bacterium]